MLTRQASFRGLATLAVAVALLACSRHDRSAQGLASASAKPAAEPRPPFHLASSPKTVCFGVGGRGIECQGEHEAWYEGAVSVTLGGRAGCVEHAAGHWACWGLFKYLRLEPGPADYDAPGVDRVPLPALDGMTSVRFGLANCGIRQGKVLCWGSNMLGSLGYTTDEICDYGATPCSHVPREVPRLEHVIDLVLPNAGGCALDRRGAVSCWGNFTASSYPHPAFWTGCIGGTGAHCEPPPPRRIQRLPPVAQLAGPEFDALFALGRDGRVYYWEGYADPDPPRVVEGIEQAVKIATGAFRVCAVLASGRVMCARGSPGPSEHTREPGQVEWTTYAAEPIDLVGDATDIAVTNDYVCVRRTTGELACWREGVVPGATRHLVGLTPRLAPGSPPPAASARLSF